MSPREESRYFSGEYGESWLSGLFQDVDNRVRALVVIRLLQMNGCPVPPDAVPPTLWPHLGVASSRERWQGLLAHPLTWRDVYSTLSYKEYTGSVSLVPATPFTQLIYRKYYTLWGSLERVCTAALSLYRSDPANAASHIAAAIGQPPRTPLQRFLIKMLMRLNSPDKQLEDILNTKVERRHLSSDKSPATVV